MIVLAVGSAALAAALLAHPPVRWPRPGSAGRWSVRPWVALVAAPVALAVSSASPVLLVWAALAAGAAAAGVLLWRRRMARRDAARASARVLESCEQLAADLSSGQPPGSALGRAAQDWPLLEPAAQAFRVGSDVPHALRSLADHPGAADLRLLAAAWQVSHRTGQGLAEAVDRIAHDLRAAQATRRVVDGELASARATARLVAGLPILALAMGAGAGGDPWGFLLRHPLGLACLAGGLAVGFLGLWWIEAIARDVDRAG